MHYASLSMPGIHPSLPSWERGLKFSMAYTTALRVRSSLPSWERGLKEKEQAECLSAQEVAPLVGAWIEISVATIPDKLISVAPLVGAWIEILHLRLFLHDIALSLPSWERGLK